MPEPQSSPATGSVEPPGTAAEGQSAWAALYLRNFRLFLVGTTLSNAAQWIQQVTLNWLVYDLTGSGTMLGTMNLVRSVATLGLAAPAGLAIDRYSRRALLLAVNAWLTAISLGLGVVLLLGYRQLWPLFVFTFLAGVAQAIDMPLRQTLVFSLVPRAVAPNAVALVQTGWSLMRSIGPGIGGFLILLFGPGGNFLIQAVAYTLVFANTLSIAFGNAHQAARRPSRGGLSEMAAGARYIAGQPKTRAFFLMGWVLPLLIIPNYSALTPIFAKEIFGGGPDTLGLLMSSVGVGGILGGVVVASLGRVEHRGRLQLGALLGVGLSLAGFAQFSALVPAMVCLALSGFFEMLFLTTNQTLLQLSIPDEMRGRVTGLVSLNAGLMPVGAMAAGAGADLIGAPSVTVTLSVLTLLVAVGAWLWSPTIRDYRMSES